MPQGVAQARAAQLAAQGRALTPRERAVQTDAAVRQAAQMADAAVQPAVPTRTLAAEQRVAQELTAVAAQAQRVARTDAAVQREPMAEVAQELMHAVAPEGRREAETRARAAGVAARPHTVLAQGPEGLQQLHARCKPVLGITLDWIDVGTFAPFRGHGMTVNRGMNGNRRVVTERERPALRK